MKRSVGIVKTQYVTFAEPPHTLELESGEHLGPITLAYETYGQLNDDCSNAILIMHALSGSAHAAGKNDPGDRKLGWWDNMIGPGKGFDTRKYFVVCSNVIGGCNGSTGPSSINPETGKPYGLSFPVVAISDMVHAQRYLMEHLGIKRWLSVAGGSMGGMQVLEWSVSYPEQVASAIAMATTSHHSAQAIAFNEVGRRAILGDPNFNNGDYYGDDTLTPAFGLSLARMIGHITYLSDESMRMKFGRRLQDKEKYGYNFSTEFQVESYLKYQGSVFTRRFDANSYLYITKAIDYFDLPGRYGTLTEAFRNVLCKYLVVSFTSDWLYPSYQAREIVRSLKANGKDVTYLDIYSPYGHDAFLLDDERLTRLVRNFLATVASEEDIDLPDVPEDDENEPDEEGDAAVRTGME